MALHDVEKQHQQPYEEPEATEKSLSDKSSPELRPNGDFEKSHPVSDDTQEQGQPGPEIIPQQAPDTSIPPTEINPSDGAQLKKLASVNDASAIPNGGLQAWLQVLGSFFLFFNSWGIINTFGTFQTYYESDLLNSSTPSAISWIGSLQAFMLMLLSALCGPAYDAGYFRWLLGIGSFCVVFGTMMLSLCTEYYQVFLAQALVVGLGTGCLFVPSVAVLSQYFTTKIATSVGIAAAGSGLGGVLYPIIFHRLQPQIGFPWTVRAIGFIALATLIVPNVVMKMRVKPPAKRALLDLSAFRETPYIFFTLGSFLGFMGLYTPFFYVQLYAIEKGITDTNLGFYLISILNTASIFGRIFPNIAADRIGAFNTIVPCAILAGILSLCLIPISSVGPIIVFLILYGFFSGSFVSLPPTILVHLSPKRSVIGTRMGMCFAITSIGLLIGTPIAGAILDARGFTSVWIFGGVLTIAGGCCMGLGRGAKVGWSVMKKA